jgi:hypothetical protein
MMFNHRYVDPDYMNRRVRRATRPLSIESLEGRSLLAVGPYLHVHNVDTLAVVDASNGELETIHQMTNFQGDDEAMNDIAFSPTGRLYGIARDWFYEINPVTGALFPLGMHGIANPTSLIFKSDGTAQTMARSSPDLFKLIISDTTLVSVTKLATLSGLDPTIGSNGDITYYQGDLLVATTDNRLIRYRFDINPDRPRIIQEVDLDSLEISDVFGLATVNGNRVYATAGTSVYRFDLSNPQSPSATKVDLANTAFGDMRGAAYYSESGGPVPVGTLSGIKWFDRNKDGLKQNNESILADWPVYIDVDLDGAFDVGEPLRRTDETGRFYFFGREPGLYTVDEIILDTNQWEQTFPATPHRNIVGIYGFDNGRADNQLSHDFGLPDLVNSLVSLTGGAANFASVTSYLELPWALGDSPFTIVLDANYGTVFGAQQFLVSQLAGATNALRDFQLTADPLTHAVTSSFCDQQGNCASSQLGTIDATEHRYAITWNGESVGSFFDDELVTKKVTGTRPDIDGQFVRFGNPSSLPTAAGLPGTVYQIRIFNRALSAAELLTAFETVNAPNAYSILLDDQHGIDGLDFGNATPTIEVPAPEIVVTRDAANGPPIASGDTINLGTASSTDPPLEAEIWITNVGKETLNVSAVTATAGFQIVGTPDTSLDLGESTSFRVNLTDRTQGMKAGEVRIANNDDNEDPFIIKLSGEILNPDTRPRQILINSTTGNLLRIDPVLGTPQSVMSGTPAMTDIAFDPVNDRLYGIDATFVYEINLAGNSVSTLFAHNVRSASALGFAPNGQLFAAGEDVYRLDLQNQSAQKYADGGSTLAGDIAFLGNRMLMSTNAGDLYEVQAGSVTLLGSLGGVAMKGLVSTSINTLYGFADNRGYLINVNDLSLTPQFGMMVFSIAGATFQPVVPAHNEDEPLDVNGDGSIVPLDALLVINELNTHLFTDPATGRLVGPPQGETRYPDVTDDGFVTPVDALLIINYLNRPAPAQAVAATDASLAVDDLFTEIATVLGDLKQRRPSQTPLV